MFRRGGKVSSRNNGIVSGFENGGTVRQNYQSGSAVDIINQYYQEPERQKGLSTSDWLRIASAGADIMGAQPTSDRGGVIGALQAASPALGSLGRDLSTSTGQREAAYQAKRDKYNALRAGTAIQEKQAKDERTFTTSERIAGEEYGKSLQADKIDAENQRLKDTITFETEMANNAATALAEEGRLDRVSAEKIAAGKRDQPFEFESKLEAYNEAFANKLLYQNQLKDLDSNDPKYQDINDQLQKAIGTISMLQKGSIASSILISTVENSLTKETVERWQSVALTIAEQGVANNEYALGSEEYYAAIKSVYDQMVSTWMSGITDAVISVDFSEVGFAQGGRVGLQNGGDPMMEQMAGPAATQTVPMNEPKQAAQLTFEELRARLPQEVTDKVIRLLVQSEEALLDFTRIQVPEDINKFNQKYGTDLTLPTQVA
tara:strand:- start:508 stop:1806 length:1299 start_codon:yes stop_codon:yes gene_type:complete